MKLVDTVPMERSIWQNVKKRLPLFRTLGGFVRTPKSRLPKDFSLEDRLAGCAQAVERKPETWRGRWHAWEPATTGSPADDGNPAAGAAATDESPASTPRAPYDRVLLDLGCGKGEYTVACARLHPETLYIGLDVEGVCVMRGAELALAEGAPNAVFVWADDPDLATLFAPGEVDGILMNFPTPFPKKKKAHLRLTHLDRLMAYRSILAPGASVRLRTDSLPFRDFSLTQIELAGYNLLWNTDDVRALFPDEPLSAYEAKLTAQGAVVCGFEAVPGPAPDRVEQTAPLSLVSYLPENIEDMGYIPHGMQGCVANMRGRRANRRAKGLSDWTPPVV